MDKQEQREHLAGLSESVISGLDGLAKVLAYAGGLAAFVAISLMLFSVIRGSDMEAARIAANVNMMRVPGLAGAAALAFGAGWLLWGEELAGPILFLVGLALLTFPGYGNSIFPEQMTKAMTAAEVLSGMGLPLVIGGLGMIVGDLIGRARMRIIQGARAEMFKYGQGVREERDIKNVFLGKCWQLPYCRKFVRERCPIYHAKRTCWKERVGCMCEEQVIRNAMQGQIIGKDSVAAAKRIPVNNTLTMGQKKKRCEACIIYNEHQKHKYRAMLPGVIIGSLLVAALLFSPVTTIIQTGLGNISRGYHEALSTTPKNNVTNPDPGSTPGAFHADDAKDVTSVESGKVPYAGIIYCTVVLVGVAYVVRFVEFLVFKYKI